ncbi:hypothetical protein HO173_004829 [Letharia columbiana]|uniref:Uncharacterized protein n=1 Tax=Letharia columbiana TaxID=112416 RepID=A0A8H6L615_9LECA|nr:uncharacterized protein HO173_004829 [Letharia columbiana]KAF6236951.1 hypothetical protein HO173_004829 [Letharia columbiana]
MCYCSGLLSTQAFKNVPVLSSFSTPCKGHLTEPCICASAFSVTPQRVSPYSLSLLVLHGMVVAKGFFLFSALLLTQPAAAAPQAHDHGCPDVDEQQLERRIVVSSTSSHASPTTSSPFIIPILTMMTIRAAPIRVSKQMQYVTSYSPIP